MSQSTWGPVLVTVGLVLVGVGALVWVGALGWLGRLPGDLRFEGERTTVYIPLASMVVISIVATLVLSLVRRVLGS